MSRFWSQVVRDIEPYVPGEQPQVEGLIKLNTNESPYGPSPRVAGVFTAEEIARLRLYPDPNAIHLRQRIASYYGVSSECVFVGNGSDEVLAQAFMAFFQQSRPLLFADITYSFYQVYCQLFGIANKVIPLASDFSINLDDYRQPNGGVVFPNPNAPTGIGLGLDAIAAFVADNRDSVVVVDEAYIDFGGDSAIGLTAEYDNLLVVQTLSKSRALAGLRVGFAVGNAALIEGLERVKNSFNSYPLGRLEQRAAEASFEDEDYFRETCRKVMATRERTREALIALGFEVLSSQANFVLAKPPAPLTAPALAAALREQKILVRYFNKPRIDQYLRISIGTEAEMDRLLEVVAGLV